MYNGFYFADQPINVTEASSINKIEKIDQIVTKI